MIAFLIKFDAFNQVWQAGLLTNPQNIVIPFRHQLLELQYNYFNNLVIYLFHRSAMTVIQFE